MTNETVTSISSKNQYQAFFHGFEMAVQTSGDLSSFLAPRPRNIEEATTLFRHADLHNVQEAFEFKDRTAVRLTIIPDYDVEDEIPPIWYFLLRIDDQLAIYDCSFGEVDPEILIHHHKCRAGLPVRSAFELAEENSR